LACQGEVFSHTKVEGLLRHLGGDDFYTKYIRFQEINERGRAFIDDLSLRISNKYKKFRAQTFSLYVRAECILLDYLRRKFNINSVFCPCSLKSDKRLLAGGLKEWL